MFIGGIIKFKTAKLAVMSVCFIHSNIAFSFYNMGCEDPEYHQYIKHRFEQIESNNKRLLERTLREYQTSVDLSLNPYRAISDLSRHLKYSAQYDPINSVKDKIDLLLDHADSLRKDQKLAASVFDGFSDENHSIGIARAWVSYRQGDEESAFIQLIESVSIDNSAVLGAFGPDFNFVRQIYQDGHIEPVLNYLEETESFWKGKNPDEIRHAWRSMISANCKIQFQSIDTIKADQLGLKTRDLSKDYGID